MARLLQGLSGAAVFTFGQTLLLRKVGQGRIGKAMGYTGTAMSAALLLGPVLGGGLYELGGPQAVFLVPTGLLVMEIVLRSLVIEGKSPLVETPTSSNRGEIHSPTVLGQEARDLEANGHVASETQPLLPKDTMKRHPLITLLLSPRFDVALFSSFTLNGLANGFDTILPAYCLDELDAEPHQVALFFLLIGGPMMLSPIAGYLTDKHGPRWPTTGGLIVLIPSLFLLRYVSRHSSHPFVKLGILLGSVGIGLSQAIPPLQAEISAAVRSIEEGSPGVFGSRGAYSLAYGLLSTAFAAGAMLGPIFCGFLRVAVGWRWVLIVMAALAAVVLVLVVMTAGKHSHHEVEPDEGMSEVANRTER